MTGIDSLIGRIATLAVENTSPCAVLSGTVVSLSPLEVSVEQRLTLGEKQLFTGKRLAGELCQGDSVLLLRAQGGQKYYVLDIV